MGGHLSCMYAGMSSADREPLHSNSSAAVLKVVVTSEGRTCEFSEPVKVAELMLEFPNHFVAEYHSIVTPAIAGVGTAVAVPVCSKRVSPLPADHDAKLSHVYLLLPMHRLNTRLSVEELNLISSLAAATPTPTAVAPQCMLPSHIKAAHTSSKVTPLSARDYQEAALHTTTTTGPITASASSGCNVSIAKSYSVPVLELLENIGSTEDFDPGNHNNNQHLHILRSRSWTPKLETIIESSQFLYH